MNRSSWIANIRIMIECFKRDFIVTAVKLTDYTINYVFLKPFVFNIGVGFLQAPIYFAQDPGSFCIRMLAGNLLIFVLAITFRTAFELLFDLENNKFVSYQLMCIDLRLLLLQRILFGTMYTFCSIAPFFFMAKLALGGLLNTANASWPLLIFMMLVGSFCCSAYHHLVVSIITVKQVSMLWIRVNSFIIMLARLPIPIGQAKNYSSFLSYVMYLNPIGYFVEGINRALTNDDRFFSVGICAFVLFAAGVGCMLLSWVMFKRRIDHV